MTILFKAVLAAHIIAGTAALAVGIVPVLTGKGSGLHRRAGRAFANVMGVVLGAAAILSLLSFSPYFAALTVSATMLTFSGVRVLSRKRPDIHPGERAQPLDWGVTLLMTLCTVFLVLRAKQGYVGDDQTVFHTLVGACTLYCAYDLLRFTFPAAWPFFPRLWLYEHLVKMLGAYCAVVSAFSGSVLTFLPIPEPWKQLWATILFQLLTAGFILYYALQRRRRRQASA
jgi:uncharacterized membrane protein